MEAHEIEIERLFIGEANVRRELGDISGLVKSVKRVGIVEPLVVRPAGEKYEVVAGSRRYEAAKRAGLTKVPCTIREMGDEEAGLVSLAENVQRGEITEEEVARAYLALKRANPKLSQRIVAERIGKDQRWLSRIVGAYEVLERLRDAGLASGMKANPTREERERGIAPIAHLVEMGYAINSVKGRLPKDELDKKLIELARAVLPLPLREARKVIERFKERPEGPLKGEEEAMVSATVEDDLKEGDREKMLRGTRYHEGIAYSVKGPSMQPIELELTAVTKPISLRPLVLLYYGYWRKEGGYEGDLGDFITDCIVSFFEEKGLKFSVIKEAG